MSADMIVPDTQHRGLVARLPERARDLAQLARFDRPIGWWLLFWPCAWGVWLTGAGFRWGLIVWLLAGAIAMRGAGCVYNDIVDADLDRKVARTASRPIASGRVSVKAAWAWLLALCAVGLVVLLQLRWQAQLVALGSFGLVAAYPFMKRLTWWPQAWLGLVFTWGAPVGWVALRGDRLEVLAALYAGAMCWCIGYDTIYALQDREDDALVGIRSSALRLGNHVRGGVMAFYGLALALWALGFWLLRGDWLGVLALAPACGHLLWQSVTLVPGNADNALARFRSNRFAGLLVAVACFVVGNA
ncbi:MAG: 4-hydroxybenzoate octaprenyltransferase [Croceibacterium sp.]